MHQRSQALPALLLGAALAGCTTYEEAPLRPAEVVAAVQAARREALLPHEAPDPAGRPPATFARVAALAKQHSPALKSARAEYATALALARVRTPLPNPSLDVGPEYGFGPEVSERRLQPVGSLGWAFPTGGRLSDQDELNRVVAAQARAAAIVRHREIYLDLRGAYGELALARRRSAVAGGAAELTKKMTQAGRALVEVGQATALDLSLLELEEARAEAAVLDGEGGVADALAALSRLTGVAPEAFAVLPAEALPTLPSEPPAAGGLVELLVANHPELARARAGYDVSEAALRLEIAKQYPDIRFGASAGGETGERKYVVGLTLGIDVPIFDRNQQGIAQARAAREEARRKYEAAVADALAELERAHARCGVALRSLEISRTRIVPLAERQASLAQKALEAGEGDALKVLEAERSYRDATQEQVSAELQALAAWTALERAVGCPLLAFPGENEGDRPDPPDGGGTPAEED